MKHPRERAARAAFQSTLPAWGETGPGGLRAGERRISIHSPRMGRDPAGRLMVSVPPAFQSTLPAWGETHPPLRQEVARRISIHSPRMGRDGGAGNERTDRAHFNPLSPHGERHRYGTSRSDGSEFQSTLPAWGETGLDPAPHHRHQHFNPLSPHGERPNGTSWEMRWNRYFNPLSPHGERLNVSLINYDCG